MQRRLLTQEQLKEVLEYFPETGKFFWKVDKGSRARKGQEAGGICKTWGYVFIRLNDHLYRAHHLAWLYVHGEFPNIRKEIDHINRDRADNRLVNLRVVGRSENNYNRGGVKGYYRRGDKYIAYMTINYNRVHLGTYKTEEEAHNAYLRAKESLTEGSPL